MRVNVRWALLLVASAAMAPTLGGCPGSLENPGEFLAAIETRGEEGGASGATTPPANASGSPFGSTGISGSAGTSGSESIPPSDAGNAPPVGDGGCGDQVPTAIFLPYCAVVGCHNASSVQFGLNLALPVNVAALMNEPTVEADGGFLLIDSTHPLESALYTKLGATPPFGLQMPYGMPPLTAVQVQCVEDWIVAQIRTRDASSP